MLARYNFESCNLKYCVLGKSDWKDRSKNRADGENSIKESNVCSVIEEEIEEEEEEKKKKKKKEETEEVL